MRLVILFGILIVFQIKFNFWLHFFGTSPAIYTHRRWVQVHSELTELILWIFSNKPSKTGGGEKILDAYNGAFERQVRSIN